MKNAIFIFVPYCQREQITPNCTVKITPLRLTSPATDPIKAPERGAKGHGKARLPREPRDALPGPRARKEAGSDPPKGSGGGPSVGTVA